MLVLVYDQGDLKAVTEKSVTTLQESMEEKRSAKSLNPVDLKSLVLDEAQVSAVESDEDIEYQVERSVKGVEDRFSSFGCLNVPNRKQVYSKSCWIACVGSVGQYKTGKYLSDADIYKATGAQINSSGDYSGIKKALSDGFNLNSRIKNFFPEEYIVDKINAGNPIIAVFLSEKGGRHAVVFDGYAYYPGNGYCALYMDPWDGKNKVTSKTPQKKRLIFMHKGLEYVWEGACFTE